MVCIIHKHTRKYTGEQHVTQRISCNNVSYNNNNFIYIALLSASQQAKNKKSSITKYKTKRYTKTKYIKIK